MKANKIYTGAELALQNGDSAIAVYPVQKGGTFSHMLTKQGRFIRLKGARLGGKGVPRYLEEAGFTLAGPDDAAAKELADRIDIEEGQRLIEDCATSRVRAIQSSQIGETLQLVPFEAEKPVKLVTVAQRDFPGSLTSVDLHSGLAMGMLEVRSADPSDFLDSVDCSKGWLLTEKEDASSVPRNTEYGGTVELAAFIVCNSGLAALEGPKNLGEGLDDDDETAPFPKGLLTLKLVVGDTIQVGIDAGDELVVTYIRDGVELYRRNGIPALKLGTVVGCIGAVLIRVREMDEVADKAVRKKRA